MQAAPPLSPLDHGEPAAELQRLVAGDGSSAELEADVLRVRDRQGAILFEYDPERGQGRLVMPTGDLRLEAPEGNVEVMAGGEIRCMAAGGVALHSATSVSMSASDGAETAGLRVDGQSAALTGRRVGVHAEEGDFRITRARYAGQWVEAGVERAELMFDKVERRVGRLVERATRAYHYVEELHQLKAGRSRTRVDDALDIDAGRVTMKAREDVDIDGRQINLG